MKRIYALVVVISSALSISKAFAVASVLGLNEASTYGTGILLPPDAGGGGVSNPNTPCITGSCISDGTSWKNWGSTDINCVGSIPYLFDQNQLSIETYECIPQGSPNYVFSYKCQLATHPCWETSWSPAWTCPTNGCKQ